MGGNVSIVIDGEGCEEDEDEALAVEVKDVGLSVDFEDDGLDLDLGFD